MPIEEYAHRTDINFNLYVFLSSENAVLNGDIKVLFKIKGHLSSISKIKSIIVPNITPPNNSQGLVHFFKTQESTR